MYSLGMFGVHPGKTAMQLIYKYMGPKLSEFNVLELCNVFWALGLLVSDCVHGWDGAVELARARE